MFQKVITKKYFSRLLINLSTCFLKNSMLTLLPLLTLFIGHSMVNSGKTSLVITALLRVITASSLTSFLNSSLPSITPLVKFPWLVSPIVGVYAKESVVSILPLYSADPVTLLPVFNKIVGTSSINYTEKNVFEI